MFGLSKNNELSERVNFLEEELKRVREERNTALDHLQSIKSFTLNGCTLDEWLKQRTDNLNLFLDEEYKAKMAAQANELQEGFLRQTEAIRLARENDKIQIAQLTTKVEMLEKVIDVGGEVVDIKDLVNKLIAKMPEIKLDNISVNVNAKPEANINN